MFEEISRIEGNKSVHLISLSEGVNVIFIGYFDRITLITSLDEENTLTHDNDKIKITYNSAQNSLNVFQCECCVDLSIESSSRSFFAINCTNSNDQILI